MVVICSDLDLVDPGFDDSVVLLFGPDFDYKIVLSEQLRVVVVVLKLFCSNS